MSFGAFQSTLNTESVIHLKGCVEVIFYGYLDIKHVSMWLLKKQHFSVSVTATSTLAHYRTLCKFLSPNLYTVVM